MSRARTESGSTLSLQEKLQSWFREQLGSEIRIEAFSYLSGGACQENWLLDLYVAEGKYAGQHRLVFRSDRGGSLLNSLSRPQEHAVASAAYQKGVKTAKPLWLERDRQYIGRPFYFMERLPGKSSARYLMKEKALQETRRRLPALLASNLALIHSITPHNASSELLEALAPSYRDKSCDPALATVDVVRKELTQFPEAHPAIELGLNWLEENAPLCDQIVLTHGDYRTGNFMVSPEGLEGILDWEFAHWGDRHEDISYLCLREWRFGRIKKHVGGFADRSSFYSSYEKASGATVDEKKCRYWEVASNLRWAIGCLQQGERHLRHIDRGIELGAIGRRVAEMEYEMMKLIENAG